MSFFASPENYTRNVTDAGTWAAAHGPTLSAIFQAFRTGLDWPDIDQLQRSLDRERRAIDLVAELVEMPASLGGGRAPGQAHLTIRGLEQVPEALPLLEDFMHVIALAAERYRSEDPEPKLTNHDLETLEIRGEQAILLSRIIATEGWPFDGGRGIPSGEWSREVGRQLRHLQGVDSIEAYLQVQGSLRYGPAPRAQSDGGDEPSSKHAGGWQTAAVRPLRWLFGRDDRVFAQIAVIVVGGLILAGLVYGIDSVAVGGSHTTATQRPTPATVASPRTGPSASPQPEDGRDPKLSGCSPPAQDVAGSSRTLSGHGLRLGTLVLRHSPACNAAWGEVRGLGPEEKLHLLIIALRPSDHARTDYSQTSGFNVEGVYGNELLQSRGCVEAIAIVQHHAKTLATARTPCR